MSVTFTECKKLVRKKIMFLITDMSTIRLLIYKLVFDRVLSVS